MLSTCSDEHLRTYHYCLVGCCSSVALADSAQNLFPGGRTLCRSSNQAVSISQASTQGGTRLPCGVLSITTMLMGKCTIWSTLPHNED